MIDKILLKIARKILEDVLGRITEQIQRIERDVLDTLKQHFQTVMGGAWIGPDADAFVNQVNTKVFPSVEKLIGAGNGQLRKMHQGITNAHETVEAADKKVANLVHDLDNEFRQIF